MPTSNRTSMLDLSWPGLTMTASGAVDLQSDLPTPVLLFYISLCTVFRWLATCDLVSLTRLLHLLIIDGMASNFAHLILCLVITDLVGQSDISCWGGLGPFNDPVFVLFLHFHLLWRAGLNCTTRNQERKNSELDIMELLLSLLLVMAFSGFTTHQEKYSFGVLFETKKKVVMTTTPLPVEMFSASKA